MEGVGVFVQESLQVESQGSWDGHASTVFDLPCLKIVSDSHVIVLKEGILRLDFP